MGKLLLLSLVLLLGAPAAWAGCKFDSGHSAVQQTISLPAAINIPRDAPVGTVLWSSGWQSGSGPRLSCDSAGTVRGTVASSVGAPVAGFNSNHGFPSVFATNVPGIGVSVYWCNQANCNPDYHNVTPVPSLAWQISATSYLLQSRFWIQLVKYDEIRQTAPLSITGDTVISYIDLPVARLTISGSTNIQALTCRVDSDAITVLLPSVWIADFNDASHNPDLLALKERYFDISMACQAGVQLSYQVDGPRAEGALNVLANGTGAGMATGVAIEVVEGDRVSSKPLTLGEPRSFGARTTIQNQLVKIPLIARYYRTVPKASMMPGKVSATATFTLYYE